MDVLTPEVCPIAKEYVKQHVISFYSQKRNHLNRSNPGFYDFEVNGFIESSLKPIFVRNSQQSG